VSEAARRLSLGRATAYRLVQTGELPSVRIGRAVRVPAQALDTWVATRTSGGADVGTPHHRDLHPPPAPALRGLRRTR